MIASGKICLFKYFTLKCIDPIFNMNSWTRWIERMHHIMHWELGFFCNISLFGTYSGYGMNKLTTSNLIFDEQSNFCSWQQHQHGNFVFTLRFNNFYTNINVAIFVWNLTFHPLQEYHIIYTDISLNPLDLVIICVCITLNKLYLLYPIKFHTYIENQKVIFPNFLLVGIHSFKLTRWYSE